MDKFIEHKTIKVWYNDSTPESILVTAAVLAKSPAYWHWAIGTSATHGMDHHVTRYAGPRDKGPMLLQFNRIIAEDFGTSDLDIKDTKNLCQYLDYHGPKVGHGAFIDALNNLPVELLAEIVDDYHAAQQITDLGRFYRYWKNLGYQLCLVEQNLNSTSIAENTKPSSSSPSNTDYQKMP